MLSNTLKTVLFLTFLTFLFVLVGQLLGGRSGALAALALAGVINLGSYWFSDRIVLRLYHAQPIEYADHPSLFSMIQRLATAAGLPMPKVYLIPEPAPNAFATGRNPEHAAIAVTSGLLDTLTDEELEGVLGHELAHIRHRDILIGSVAATISGAIAYLAHMAQWTAMFGGFGRRDDEEEGGNIFSLLILMIVAPVTATIIQLAISRSREFLADRVGAQISGKPLALANALVRLDRKNQDLPMMTGKTTAHLFIVSPLHAGGFVSLFRTHPSTEERVARLHALAGETGVFQ